MHETVQISVQLLQKCFSFSLYGAGIVESNWSIDPYRHAVAQRGPKHSCVLREMFYYGAAELPPLTQTNKKAVLPQGNRAMLQVFFSVEVRQQHSLQV